MKQAKIALTATAVLAIIGGAIAFKSRVSGFDVYSRTTTNGSCNVLVGEFYKTTTIGDPVAFATSPVTSTQTCPLLDKITPAE